MQKFSCTNTRQVEHIRQTSIDCHFKKRDSGDYILLCPSSPTVTMQINGISQEEWIKQVGEEVRKHTDRPIKVRNKPRPGNEW